MRNYTSMFLAIILSLGFTTGCEMLSTASNVAKLGKEIGENMEKNLKSKLTAKKIEKVIEVSPKLIQHLKKSKQEWVVNYKADDVKKLASTLGKLSSFVSFFESHDTTVSEFYIDYVKINDALLMLQMRDGNSEANKKIKSKMKELEKQASTANPEQKKQLEKQLDEAKRSIEKLKKIGMRTKIKKMPYRLSEEEIKLVEKHEPQLRAMMKKLQKRSTLKKQAPKTK